MSANYNYPTDEEICEKRIATLRKLYKIENQLPKHIRDDITRVLENIGWSCWFADWINHRIYCWVLEVNASKSKPDTPDFIYWEDISSETSSESEEEVQGVVGEDIPYLEEEETMDDLAEFFEEDGECKDCGWRSEYPQSHILYCGGSGCVYIRNKYRTWFDNEELRWRWQLK